MTSLINTGRFIVNKQIKEVFATNGIILIKIHWKISINLFINSQKKLYTVKEGASINTKLKKYKLKKFINSLLRESYLEYL